MVRGDSATVQSAQRVRCADDWASGNDSIGTVCVTLTLWGSWTMRCKVVAQGVHLDEVVGARQRVPLWEDLAAPTIPAGKSRTCTTFAVPIPPQVAIMLDGVTSTGTKPCRLRSRSHRRRAAETPPQVAVLQCPSSHELVPGSNQ